MTFSTWSATARPPSEFDDLVIRALDDPPEHFLARCVEDTPVTVFNRGHEFRAYGHYIGGTMRSRRLPRPHITARLTRTLWSGTSATTRSCCGRRSNGRCASLAHHLGWDERGVRDLGL